MGELTVANFLTFLVLTLLQAVLGFDNLLYISLESKRVDPEKQSFVRRVGIIGAIGLRILLLLIVLQVVEKLKTPFLNIDKSYVAAHFTVHSIIVLLGGAFILYTAVKEIMHLLSVNDLGADKDEKRTSVGKAILMIVIMNLVFSFDSILSAIALTKVVWVMSAAIVVSGIMMVALADTVSDFLKKNRLYEVLGLFILFIVGIMLISEGGHLAHLKFFGQPVEQMSKTTFYFVLVVLVVVDLIQGRYQKKLLAQAAAERSSAP